MSFCTAGPLFTLPLYSAAARDQAASATKREWLPPVERTRLRVSAGAVVPGDDCPGGSGRRRGGVRGRAPEGRTSRHRLRGRARKSALSRQRLNGVYRTLTDESDIQVVARAAECPDFSNL